MAAPCRFLPRPEGEWGQSLEGASAFSPRDTGDTAACPLYFSPSLGFRVPPCLPHSAPKDAAPQGTCSCPGDLPRCRLHGCQEAPWPSAGPGPGSLSTLPSRLPAGKEGGADVARPAFPRRAAARLRGPALPGEPAFSEPDRSALTSRLVLRSRFFPLWYKLRRHRNSL